MNNSDLIWNIKIVIMKKKFDLFYEKYSDTFSNIDIRSTFFNEFEIKDDYGIFLHKFKTPIFKLFGKKMIWQWKLNQ